MIAILIILFVLSCTFNVVLFIYIRATMERFSDLVEFINEFIPSLFEFRDHLGGMLRMNILVKDPNLIDIMRHTNALYDYLIEYLSVNELLLMEIINAKEEEEE